MKNIWLLIIMLLLVPDVSYACYIAPNLSNLSINIKIEVVKAVHGYMPFLKGGNEINENVGYIIDDGKNRVYQTSDSISFENDYKCDVLCVPVCNHGLVMGPFESALFAIETEAKLVIPIHYDNPKFPANFEEVKKQFTDNNLNYNFLEVGESVEV